MKTHRIDSGIVIEAPATFDTDIGLSDFSETALALLQKGEKDITVDLKDVRALNSKAIGKILSLYKKMKAEDVTMRFINLNPKLYELFNRLAFNQLFEFSGQ